MTFARGTCTFQLNPLDPLPPLAAEEESEHSSSDDGYDPEGGTFHPGGRPSGLKQRWRDGDSYGYGSDSDG